MVTLKEMASAHTLLFRVRRAAACGRGPCVAHLLVAPPRVLACLRVLLLLLAAGPAGAAMPMVVVLGLSSAEAMELAAGHGLCQLPPDQRAARCRGTPERLCSAPVLSVQ